MESLQHCRLPNGYIGEHAYIVTYANGRFARQAHIRFWPFTGLLKGTYGIWRMKEFDMAGNLLATRVL